MTSRANPEHWVRLCKAIGREDIIDDPCFRTPADRAKNEEPLNAIITEWTQARTKQEAMAAISGVSVPAGAVFDTMELQSDPNFEERGIMQTFDHPTHGTFKMPAWPVQVDGRSPRIAPSPILGQHTGDVLTSWLGLSADDIGTLKSQGVAGA
jgi:formyl-CoA transferase